MAEIGRFAEALQESQRTAGHFRGHGKSEVDSWRHGAEAEVEDPSEYPPGRGDLGQEDLGGTKLNSVRPRKS